MKTNKTTPTRSTDRFAKSQPEITLFGHGTAGLSKDEERRLNKLAAALGTTPVKTVRAALRNLLGYRFDVASHQRRVIDLANEMADTMKWA